jgi:hypothetical protein
MDMSAIAKDETFDVVALMREAIDSQSGLLMSSTGLRRFAGRLVEFEDGIVVGYWGNPPDRTDADMRSSAEIAIVAFDSTFWRVYARDPVVLDRVRKAYDGVTVRRVGPEFVGYDEFEARVVDVVRVDTIHVRDVDPEAVIPPMISW